MNKDEHLSEEQLNAFVDGELDPEEKSRLYNEAARSPELDQRLCRQRNVKELIKHAYENVPAPMHSTRARLGRSRFFGRALAAGVLLAVGLTAGLLGHSYFDQSRIVAAGSAVEPIAKVSNFLLHVTSGDAEQMYAALHHAEALLEEAEDGEQRRVEIIANERGIDLLRRDVTPFAREIAMLQEHDVVFYACSKTIQRLEDSGVRVELVPHTNADYTALDRVVSRMQDGWKYEKI
jgi:intracellular sulfur oxidation DsrE/DsrF family protein